MSNFKISVLIQAWVRAQVQNRLFSDRRLFGHWLRSRANDKNRTFQSTSLLHKITKSNLAFLKIWYNYFPPSIVSFLPGRKPSTLLTLESNKTSAKKVTTKNQDQTEAALRLNFWSEIPEIRFFSLSEIFRDFCKFRRFLALVILKILILDDTLRDLGILNGFSKLELAIKGRSHMSKVTLVWKRDKN